MHWQKLFSTSLLYSHMTHWNTCNKPTLGDRFRPYKQFILRTSGRYKMCVKREKMSTFNLFQHRTHSVYFLTIDEGKEHTTIYWGIHINAGSVVFFATVDYSRMDTNWYILFVRGKNIKNHFHLSLIVLFELNSIMV